MMRRILLSYQFFIGLCDAFTGALLIVAPEFTMRLMALHPPPDSLPFLSLVGAFVLSVGLSCLYGAVLTYRGTSTERIEIVWLLTAVTRAAVAIFVLQNVVSGTLEPGWLTVAISDGACVVIQGIGLQRRWLRDVAL